MPSERGAAPLPARAPFACLRRLVAALAISGALVWPAHANERPEAALLLDRLCANTLRANEEDRLFGLISLTARATLRYRGAAVSPDLIDGSIQDGLGSLMEACPRIADTPDPQRLGLAVDLVREATLARADDPNARYSSKQLERATAADLSQALSAHEIDAWLDGLTARQRALALFLFASDVTPDEIAAAVGLPRARLAAALRGVKADLLKFLRQEWEAPPPAREESSLEYRPAGQALAALLAPGAEPLASAHITGIAADVHAGWSLLASITGLPADRRLDISEPLLLEPEHPDQRRMLAVALEEISDPRATTRHFLIKAYPIDHEKDGAGLRDRFRLAPAAPDNPQARETLRRRDLAASEIGRCLAHDYRTGPDPGLCR